METYKKLLNNSLIFAIGNMGSKIITILLVPLYTYYLTTTEFGTVDIITTTTNMLLPLVSLSIYDAVLRYIMDDATKDKLILTNALFVTLVGSAGIVITYQILKFSDYNDVTNIYFAIILILQAFQTLFAQFLRATGKVTIYAMNGIVMAISTALLNILFLVVYNLGINGYLMSIIGANFIAIIFMTITGKLYKYIGFHPLDLQIIKKMLVYSIPLIPNAFMWWIMNASNRYFILFFYGAAYNGLFAVASKVPSLLSIFNSIFSQAWQLSAIEEFNSENKSKFYSNVFNIYSVFLLSGTSMLLVFIKIIMTFIVAPSFYYAWKYVPFLLLAVVFSSFSTFLGTNYIAAKQTNGVMKTTLIGGVLNIILNFIFVPLMGVNGAGLATLISMFTVWIIRIYDTKKFINMNLDLYNIIISLTIILIQILVLYLEIGLIAELIIECIIFFSLIYFNKNVFKIIITFFIAKFK